MAQEIFLKRSSNIYETEGSAWSALDNHTFKKGEPIVAFYTKSGNIHGDSSVAAIYAVGTDNAKGKYQAFASYEDFYAVWTTIENSIKTDIANLKAMWKLEDGKLYTDYTIISKGDGVFGGEYSGGSGGGGTGEGGSSTLAGLTDVRDNGAGSVAGSTGAAAAVGSLFAFNGTDWYAITKAELANALKSPLIDTGMASQNYVDTAIQDAKDVRVDTLVGTTIPKIEKDIEGLGDSIETLEGAIEDLGEAIDNIPVYTIATTTVSDENVKEAYQLKKGDTPVGEVIKIYKDSALQEVYLGSSSDTVNATTGVVTKNTITDAQSLNFVYLLTSGKYSLTKIDVSKFLTQSEFGNGLQVSSGKVSVKVDPNSQDNLTVSANGIKLSGVAQASDLNNLDERVETAEDDISSLKSRTVTAGNGLTGGGDLTANRELSVKANGDSIDVSTNGVKVNTLDNLTSTSTSKPLSANQGKVLKGLIDTAQEEINTLETKGLTAGTATAASGTLLGGAKVDVKYDNSSVKVNSSNQLYVSVIDGGTF